MTTYNELRQSLKTVIKEAVWSVMKHHSCEQKNICLFSTRRSGSTLLMEVIATNRGIRYIDQPFSLYSATPNQLRFLPVFESSQFIYPDKDEETRIRAYLQMLFEGSLVLRGPWEFWTSDWDLVSNRVVLKILEAKALIEWIDQNFDVHIVYSTRHPIPTALSIIQNQWGLTAKAYLRNSHFAERYLDSNQLAYCWRVLDRGTLLQKHMLNWGLENMIPISLLPANPHWLYVSYEQLVLNPTAVVERLASELELTDVTSMTRKIREPSRSTKMSSREVRQQLALMQSKEISDFVLHRWKQQVSDQEERKAFEVLNELGITFYRYGERLPTMEIQ